MNRVLEVLCRRDGLSVEEAMKRISQVQEQLAQANYDYDEVEDILANELGLEMDYIMDIL